MTHVYQEQTIDEQTRRWVGWCVWYVCGDRTRRGLTRSLFKWVNTHAARP